MASLTSTWIVRNIKIAIREPKLATVRQSSIRQAPVFGTSAHYGKAHGSLLSGQIICNYTIYVAGLLHPAIF